MNLTGLPESQNVVDRRELDPLMVAMALGSSEDEEVQARVLARLMSLGSDIGAAGGLGFNGSERLPAADWYGQRLNDSGPDLLDILLGREPSR